MVWPVKYMEPEISQGYIYKTFMEFLSIKKYTYTRIELDFDILQPKRV